ncbi:phthalate 4,5-dioxygenase [Thozetella sp. PMI_491]|nr:phthalate 4,5-dioxygenase [Thozetella sp. PMI_491]
MASCPFNSPHRLFEDLAAIRSAASDPETEAGSRCPFDKTLNGFVVTRYDDIVHVLDQPELFSSRPTVPDFPPPVAPLFAGRVPSKGTLLGWDNPDHDRLRRSVSSFFVPRRLAQFEPLMRAKAHELIDGFIASGSVDVKSAFALPLPLQMVVTIAGLDPDRWEWIGRGLALFGGITEAGNASIQEKVQNVLDLHDYVATVIQERKTDRRNDLISHIWNERDAGVVEMTDFEHLAMIPGLLLAGHETTTNVLSMALAHLLHRGLWETVTRDEQSITAAIEELLRYESAITGMPREVTQKTEISGQTFEAGDRLFVAYNSGSRDPTYFSDPATLDIDRKPKTQHLGFGRGIHACLGAPFARLLLRTEFAVIRERIPNLRLVTKYEEVPYGRVHEARGVREVQIAWDPPAVVPAAVSGPRRDVVAATKPSRSSEIQARVQSVSPIADGILQFSFSASPGRSLPSWTPGAHIDIPVGNLGYRQYSLCSSQNEPDVWQIAVLKEEHGLGGSKFLHETVSVGKQLAIRGPRNHFAFSPARHHVFIAGGIGITPIRPMLEAAKQCGSHYRLVYLGKSRSTMAYWDELARDHPTTIWAKDEQGARFDLHTVLSHSVCAETDDMKVYCCGPESLVTALEEHCAAAGLPTGALRVERFASTTRGGDRPKTAFDVLLERSGRRLHVPKDRSVLEVLRDNGVDIMSTCSKGVCGTCEVGVVDCQPDHRDAVLSDLEKAENQTMMTCVSRCLGRELVLDLW